MLRKCVFWTHLAAGTVAGAVVLVMSVTGVLLMYEKQMIAWADSGYRAAAPSPGAPRLPVETLLERIRREKHSLPSTITIRAGTAEPAMLVFGRDKVVYADPYTGSVLGEGSRSVREFFRLVTGWHRWLGTEGEGRAAARAITGACNLGFLFLVLSGIYLWWPRSLAWPRIRTVMFFRRGLSGKARDFNWHNVIGFWCCVPLFFIVTSGVVISYPWASNLVYSLAGGVPPRAGAPRPGGPGPGQRPVASIEGIDKLWARAEQHVAGWRSISLRLPDSDRAPLDFTIDQGTGGQPQKRGTLRINRKTGEVERCESFASFDSGRRLRSWLRFVHTGEYYGIAGQTVAGIASGGAAMLVWTGIALALRRLRRWRSRDRQERAVAAATEGVSHSA